MTQNSHIWLAVSNWTQLFRFILDQHLQFNLTQFSDLIWLNHSTHHLRLNSSFLIQFESSSPILFDSSFIIQFDAVTPFDLTQTSHSWITFSDLSYLFRFNFTQNFRFNLAQHFQFNLIGGLDLIRLPLHQLDSPFMIQLIFSDSIWIIISDPIQLIISESIWLSYPIWLEKHCKHLDHCFKFD